MVYLNDVIGLEKTFDDHLTNLEEFKSLKYVDVKLNPKKFKIFQEKSSKYLGYIVLKDGVSVNLEKTHAVKELSVPKDLHELRIFLGLCIDYLATRSIH